MTLTGKDIEIRESIKGDELRAKIFRAIDSSPSLPNKKYLIDVFVDNVSLSVDVDAN